jgi:hypothetical protein
VKNIRKAVTKTLLFSAVTGALAVPPVAMSTGTANADTVNWDAIAECESGGNWSTNTGNGHYGGLQFKQATWTSNGGAGSPATASRQDQIRVAENVLRTQGIRAWPKCGANAAGPAVWSAPSAGTGCQALQFPSLFGMVDFQRMCSALLNPLATFTLPR